MARRIGMVAIAGCLVCLAPGSVSAQQPECRQTKPVNTLEAMWKALSKCWQPPVGSAGFEVTVRFSLKRDGSLNGVPRITWLRQEGTKEEQMAFVASVFSALDRALPIPLTEAMGNVTAGRPMTMRFKSPDPNEKTL